MSVTFIFKYKALQAEHKKYLLLLNISWYQKSCVFYFNLWNTHLLFHKTQLQELTSVTDSPINKYYSAENSHSLTIANMENSVLVFFSRTSYYLSIHYWRTNSDHSIFFGYSKVSHYHHVPNGSLTNNISHINWKVCWKSTLYLMSHTQLQEFISCPYTTTHDAVLQSKRIFKKKFCLLPNTLQSFWKVILESNSTGSKLKSGEWNDTCTYMHTHKAWEWCKLNYSFSKECILRNI